MSYNKTWKQLHNNKRGVGEGGKESKTGENRERKSGGEREDEKEIQEATTSRAVAIEISITAASCWCFCIEKLKKSIKKLNIK